MIPLFDGLDRDRAQTFSLVLNASGIGNRVAASQGGFRIDVPPALVNEALEAIGRYLAENPVDPDPVPAVHPPPSRPPLSGVVIAVILLAIHLAVMHSGAPDDYTSAFGADARRILRGEVYRCVTALLLHADAAHIAGNMAGIALFGGAVCAVAGNGVGWLLILVGGILGNLVNAHVHETNHLSIGASTAVFAAVGIQCAFQAVVATRTGRGWRRVMLIVGAGIALLAFMGTSERSDLGAHLFGFAVGLASGTVYRLFRDEAFGWNLQIVSGAAASLILILAWIQGAMGW
jgi:membrane associated rhomboid family serine protease